MAEAFFPEIKSNIDDNLVWLKPKKFDDDEGIEYSIIILRKRGKELFVLCKLNICVTLWVEEICTYGF